MTVLNQLDSFQQKSLRITGVDHVTACRGLVISRLRHRREVVADTVVYKMHNSHCPIDLYGYVTKCVHVYKPRGTTTFLGITTGASTFMRNHALAIPTSRTSTLDRSFLHTATLIWNKLPDAILWEIKSNDVQSFNLNSEWTNTWWHHSQADSAFVASSCCP